MGIYINKLYTRTGDEGETSLANGEKTVKSDLRVQCFGSCDELNSIVGMIRTLSSDIDNNEFKLSESCRYLQGKIFDMGAVLSKSNKKEDIFNKNLIEDLEGRIDFLTEKIEPLTAFIFPGGTIINSWCHLARTACRRLERQVWKLNKSSPVKKELLIFINRLSDFFFAMARYASKESTSP